MEMFFVSMNYPAESLRFEPSPGGYHPRPGRVVFSNAFSAVRRDVALEITLPEEADYSEDQIWAQSAGVDRGASFRQSVRFLAIELRYFIRQGHVHRLPQLPPYEFLRWAGFQVGRPNDGRGASTVGWSASDAREPTRIGKTS